MAVLVRYREVNYILFAIWVAGLVDIVCAFVIPGQRRMMLFDSRLDIIPVPVCGELLILAENTPVAQSCESFTYR